MAYFTRKPLLVEAVQFDPDKVWIDEDLKTHYFQGPGLTISWPGNESPHINTLGGRAYLREGLWIINDPVEGLFVKEQDGLDALYAPVVEQ